MSVVLPAPVAPTIASELPRGMVKEICRSAQPSGG
jgi:hypothetical protein